MKNELAIGKKYWIVTVNAFAATGKSLIEITGTDGDRYTFKFPGKRKELYLDIDNETLVFEENDVPRVDSDGNSFMGDARLHLCGTPESVREVVKRNLNDEFDAFDRVDAYDEAAGTYTRAFL